MIANFVCWIIAIALILSDHNTPTDLYTKLLFALGFIFMGTASKAVDVYCMVHMKKSNVHNNNNT